MSEHVALQLSKDIAAGRYVEGERLVEADVAAHFSVSRGPVRDAFQLLERRRFITFEPRKGAFVRAISLDSIADIFNVRGALFCTAARFMAKHRPKEAMTLLAWRVEMVQFLADDPDSSVAKFMSAIVQIGDVLVWGSGSDLIAELLRDLDQHSIWADLWTTSQHFKTQEVRQWHARLITATGEAIQRGESELAGQAMQQVIDYNRDMIIKTLAIIRNEQVSPARML